MPKPLSEQVRDLEGENARLIERVRAKNRKINSLREDARAAKQSAEEEISRLTRELEQAREAKPAPKFKVGGHGPV